MENFRTEKQIEKDLNRTYLVPILYPNGHQKLTSMSFEAWTHYQVLRDMGVPPVRFMRFAKSLEKKTALPYPDCFSIGAILGPNEFFEGWPGSPFHHR